MAFVTILARWFVSIHAPRAGRDGLTMEIMKEDKVSIHAPRAGRDFDKRPDFPQRLVSIHAPRAGRDVMAGILLGDIMGFNPRAPRGARPAEKGE